MLGLRNGKKQHQAATHPVLQAPLCHHNLDTTFWLQLRGDRHLHVSHVHGELGHPRHEECVIRDDGVNSNSPETSLASAHSRNQI